MIRKNENSEALIDAVEVASETPRRETAPILSPMAYDNGAEKVGSDSTYGVAGCISSVVKKWRFQMYTKMF